MNFSKRQLAIDYRGKVIQDVILLEKMMDIYISKHFCGDDWVKIEEMLVLFLGNDRMSFAGKQEIFNILIKRNNPEALSANPNIFKDFEDIKKHRNILAHYMVDATDDDVAPLDELGTLIFYKFKNKVEQIEYTEQGITDILEKIKTNVLLIRDLTNIKDSNSQ